MNICAINNSGNYNRFNLTNQKKNNVSFKSGFEKCVTEEMEKAIVEARKLWIGNGPGNEYQVARFEQKVEEITGGIRKMSEQSKKVLQEESDWLFDGY